MRPPRGVIALGLHTTGGETIELGDLRGRPVVLHIFATWSLGAQSDIDQLVDAYDQFSNQVAIIGLALDLSGEELVGPWRRANRIPYPITLADADIREGRSKLGRISEVPTTVILSRDGRVAHWLPRPLAPGELVQLLSTVLSSR